MPRELRYQLEDGLVLGSCDWGLCHGEQAGWAQGKGEPGWLAICARCAAGHGKESEPVPVDRYVTFEEVERVTHY